MKKITLKMSISLFSIILINGYSQQTLTTINSWNAYVHLPWDYSLNPTKTYPTIIFIPGLGEVGTVASKVIQNGPGAYITQGWNGGVKIGVDSIHFIVISLQPSAAYPPESSINTRIQTIKSLYRVDNNRLHLTGLSHGGWCSTTFVTGDALGGPYTYADQIATVVEVEGVKPDDNLPYPNLFDNFALSGGRLLGFEQTLDNRDIPTRVNRMNSTVPNSGIFVSTNYGGGGHCCWEQYYGGSGHTPNIFLLDGINQNIYQWMARNPLPSAINSSPIANAGGNKTIILPTNTVTLNGSATDSDGTIASYAWTKQSGGTATLTAAATATLNLSGLVAGTYVFRLTATDNLGATGISNATVSVNTVAVNNSPIANAGGNKTITLPTNSVALNGSATDSDGTIASYAWAKQSGGAATLTGATTATLNLSALVSGTYVFRLTATDNQGATGISDATVTVNSASGINQAPIAIAGSNQTITTTSAILNGSGTDDGTVVSYKWSKLSVPGQTNKRIGVIGSGTAKGYLVPADSGYVALMKKYYKSLGLIDTIYNLSQVYLNIYDGMPTGYTPPAGRPLPNANYNITKVLSKGVDVVIVNFPSSGYDYMSVAEVMKCFRTIANTCVTANVPYIITTTQPRLGFSPSEQLNLKEMKDSILLQFPNNSVNFYDGMVMTGTTTTLPEYNLDNTNFNSAGHRQLFRKIVAVNPIAYTISSSSSINSTSSATTNVTSLSPGTHKFQLGVIDNIGLAGSDITTVIVNTTTVNNSPTANAGGNKTITLPTNTVTLNGSATDSDGTIASYAWTKQSGGVATLTGATTPTLNLSGLVAGTYVFRLTVTDNLGATGISDATVTVNTVVIINQAPIAIAGSNQTTTLTSVTLNGSGTDDGTIVSYKWTKLSVPGQSNKRIGVIGSSTSKGYGVPADSNYVYLTKKYYKGLGLIDTIYNISQSTTTIYEGMPTGYAPPAGRPVPNTSLNITNILSKGVNVVIVNYPSNGYDYMSVAEVMNCFRIIANTCTSAGVSYIMTTTQPRLGFSPLEELRLKEIKDSILVQFPNNSVNFYDGMVMTGSTNTLPEYDLGDGVHFNTSGHYQLFRKIIAVNPIAHTISSSSSINSPNSATTTVTSLSPGIHKFQLGVTDNIGLAGGDVTTITVNNSPTANAGGNKTITLPTNTVSLNGSAIDSDGTIASYAWTKQSGGVATLTGATTATLNLSALVAGAYVFRLTSTDNLGATGISDATVTVTQAANIAPTANAGGNKTMTLPTNTVTLNGSATDSDGTIASYAWTKQSGGTAILTGTTTATLNLSALVAGTYVFRLTATDNLGATGISDATVTVNSASGINQAPVAIAGGNQTITATSVTLNGSGTDDGTIVGYKWSKLSVPGQTNKRIGVIGSETSKGTGVPIDSGYVSLMKKYYKGLGLIDTIYNLSQAWLDIYQGMPTGYTPPAGRSLPDNNYNITKILSKGVDVVIVNYASRGYDYMSVAEVMKCFRVIANTCITANVPYIITTTQPRLGFSPAERLKLKEMKDSILVQFPNNNVNFYDGMVTPGTNATLPEYNLDNTNFNSAGQRQLFRKIVAVNPIAYTISSSSSINSPNSAITTVTSLSPGIYKFQLGVTDNIGLAGGDIATITVDPIMGKAMATNLKNNIDYESVVSVFPNPTKGELIIDYKKADEIKIVNMLGLTVYQFKINEMNEGTKMIDLTYLSNGMYMVIVSNGNNISGSKIILSK